MPRRMISPEIWRNEKVGSLPDTGRLLFIGMFSNADDDGRLKASPRYLRALIFCYDNDKTDDDVRQLRDQCADLGLIRLYLRNGFEYLDIPGWSEHQRIRPDRHTASRLPSYDDVAHDMTTVCPSDGNQMATMCPSDGNQMATMCPSDGNQTATMCPSDGNQTATDGDHSEGKVSLAKASSPTGGRRKTPSPPKEPDTVVRDGELLPTAKSESVDGRRADTSTKKQKRPTDPRVSAILVDAKRNMGFPDSMSTDPVPNYGKEGTAIRRMLDRGFTPEEILACWQEKVDASGGDYVTMTWVNEDIGKKQGHHPSTGRNRKGRWSRELPKKYTPSPEYDDI